MRRWLLVGLVSLVAACNNASIGPIPPHDTIDLETLATQERVWTERWYDGEAKTVRGQFNAKGEFVPGSVAKDGSYIMEVKGGFDNSIRLSSAQVRDVPTFKGSSRERFTFPQLASLTYSAMSGNRTHVITNARRGWRPANYTSWFQGAGFRALWYRSYEKCLTLGIFDCRVVRIDLGAVNLERRVTVRVQWNTFIDTNRADVLVASKVFNDGTVVVNGHNDQLFATRSVLGAAKMSARYTRVAMLSATATGRDAAINRLMTGSFFYDSLSASAAVCNQSFTPPELPDGGGGGGGGSLCYSPRFIVQKSCKGCAEAYRRWQNAEDNLIRIENDLFPDVEAKGIKFTGALAVCGAALYDLVVPGAGAVTVGGTCGFAAYAGVDAVQADFFSWRNYNNWRGTRDKYERESQRCAAVGFKLGRLACKPEEVQNDA